MTIWYEVLAAINEVSKDLQSKDICINVAIEQVQGLIAYFEKYRETGFAEDMINAKKLAIEMEIDSVFPEKRQVRRKRHFDENQAIGSLKRRFEEYQAYDDIFGFLFISERLNSMDNDKLKDCCDRLQNFLKKCEFFDVDGDALFVELKLLQEPLPKEMKTSIDILNYLKRMRDCKHCVQNLVDCTCYRCICGKKFLKVKVIKIILAINYVAGKVKWTCFDID
ncbi:hypothetical protein ACFX15_002112 [Malus domestica]